MGGGVGKMYCKYIENINIQEKLLIYVFLFRLRVQINIFIILSHYYDMCCHHQCLQHHLETTHIVRVCQRCHKLIGRGTSND